MSGFVDDGVMKQEARVIHLALTAASAMGRCIMEGIADYAGRRPDWRFHMTGPDAVEVLGPDQADAIVGSIHEPVAARWSGQLRRRVVQVSRMWDVPGAANVTCDDADIGRLAAEHLIEKGLRQFAYIGPTTSGERETGFVQTLAERGFACPVYHFRETTAQTRQWIAELPRPCGVLAFNDQLAASLVESAGMLGIAVPQDLAIVGADNDTLISRFAVVPLTSVDPGFHEVGRQAAAMLDRIFQGEAPLAEPIRVPPMGVVERHSTDFPGESDEVAVRAARMIRQRACEGISVADVAAVVPVTRRSLERRYRQAFGRTVHEEIQAVRLNEAARLLRETADPIDVIAGRVGFATASHFSVAFSRHIGQSPSAYRRHRRDKPA